jgi:hypothetical protein
LPCPWLRLDGQHLPLKRIVEDLAPITSIFPGAPSKGTEAEAARQLAERLEDVRLAAAILAGAAEKAEAAIDATRYIRFVPLAAQRTWVRPLIAARQPLRAIIEDCAAFEDAIAGAGTSAAAPGNTSTDVGEPTVYPTIAAVEATRAAMPDERTQATIALVSKTIAVVSPCVEAVERGASVGSRSLITAIDRRLD